MSSLAELARRIDDHSATLGIIGLGYVGLPVAALFANAGFRVIGIEQQTARVAILKQGGVPLEGDEPGLAEALAEAQRSGRFEVTSDPGRLREAVIVLLCVETPIDPGDHRPRYAALEKACRSVGAALSRGALVIVESTLSPGTIERVVRPIIEAASGLRSGHDFYLGHCPERVMPGRLLQNLRTMSRVCGGTTPATAEVMVALYRQIVQADLDSTDAVTAELVKTAENAYRDVNIAFANELALICESVGADVLRVRELVNKSPGRDVLLPGAGVGGHCIPKDPWLLAAGAGESVPVRLIPAARAVNDAMPSHMAQLIALGLSAHGRALRGSRIALLGYAYLENTGDTRNSPSVALAEHLEGEGASVTIHDPFVPEHRGPVEQVVRGADAVALAVAHHEYRSLSPAAIRELLRTPVIVDGRRVLDAAACRDAGLTYLAVGLPFGDSDGPRG
jgi:UDP-N-acetyl-D-mannosaminuronic acid dehydrogenase